MSRMEDFGKAAHEVLKGMGVENLRDPDRIAMAQVYADVAKAAAVDRQAAAIESIRSEMASWYRMKTSL